MQGQITWVKRPTSTFGYIGRETIRDENGQPVALKGKKDIYLHKDDSLVALYEGMLVSFDVTPDPSRVGELRATNVKFVPRPIGPITASVLVCLFLVAGWALYVAIRDYDPNCAFGDGLERSMNEASGYVCDY